MLDPRTLPGERDLREAEGLARADRIAPAGREDWVTVGRPDHPVRALLLVPKTPRSTVPDIYVHGGGWVYGSPLQALAVLRRIVAQTGRPLYAVKYALAPENPWPAAVLDVCSVFDGLGGAGAMGGVIGSSAGSQIGLEAMIRQRDSGHPMPGAGFLVYGAFAMATDSLSHRIHGHHPDGLTSAEMADYIAAYAPGPDATEQADMTRADMAGLPPLWFFCGDADPLLDDTLTAFRSAMADGTWARLQILAGRKHGCLNDFGEDATVDAALTEALDWMVAEAG